MSMPSSNFALEIIGLNKAFGGLPVTQGVSLSIRPGERRLIIGPNGAGKTTLFNQISGDMRPNSGRIKLFGEDVTKLPPYRRAHRGLSRTYQIITLFAGRHPRAQHHARPSRPASFALADVAAAVVLSSSRHRSPRGRSISVGLLHLADHPVSELAYGEKRRVEIAMALAQKPRVLLLDEPLAGLSDERTTRP